MRIDKYLWAIRVFKTRSLATASCREGRVLIQDDTVKPARAVNIGEEIVIKKGAVYFKWKVLELPKSRVGPPLVPTYAEDITSPEEKLKLQMIRLGQNQRPKGIGRPTKRDRRDWDKHFT